MKRFIVLNSGGVVVAIRYGDTIVENELESSQGEIGQKLVDEKFVDVPVEPKATQKSLSEQIDELKLRQESTEEAISFLLGL